MCLIFIIIVKRALNLLVFRCVPFLWHVGMSKTVAQGLCLLCRQVVVHLSIKEYLSHYKC